MIFPQNETSDSDTLPNVEIDEEVTIGYPRDEHATPTRIGPNSIIRSGSIIYHDVTIGANCRTGHRVLVREQTKIGDEVTIGTNVVIDGNVNIGSRVSLQTAAYIPPGTIIGDDVFVGPYAVLTNDPYPLRVETELDGPTLENHVTIGANATVLPDVVIGHGSFIAAGAVVTTDVPRETLALGNPAEHRPLPDELSGGNVVQ